MDNYKDFAESTLSADMDLTTTSMAVTDGSKFPAAPFRVVVGTEIMHVTSKGSGNDWTVVRGYDSSTVASHNVSTKVEQNLAAGDITDLRSSILPVVTSVGSPGADTSVPTEQAVREAIAAIPSGLANPLTATLNADNHDITLVKLLTLHGEIDDGAGANAIDWNAGPTHKVALGAPTTLAFEGVGPDLTSPGGIITALDPWYPAANAFDNSPNYGYSNSFSTHSSPAWITYQFTEAKTILIYSIASANSGDFGGSAIQSWTLQGSMNGEDWTVLDTRDNAFGPAENQVKKYFTVASPGSYIYYKLNITVPGPPISVAEIEYIASGTTNPAAPCFLTLKLVQDGTGGRTVTWPATVKGTPVIKSAPNAVSIVSLYWDGTYYWVVNEAQELPLVTTVADPGVDTSIPTEQAVREAIAAIPAGLSNPLTAALDADNHDLALVKLLTLHGEIDDGNSGVADIIDWNAGAAHKSTLTGNVTLAFTGYGEDVATGGTPSASSTYSGYSASSAFDNNTGTKWKSGSATPQWIQYQFASAKTIIVYRLMKGAYAITNGWTLQGSNDGTNFTTISTVTGSGDLVTSEWKYFTVDSPGSYVYYRLYVNSNGASADFYEIEFIDFGISNPATPCFLTLKLVQDATGGRTVAWPATVKGTITVASGANAVTIIHFYFDGTYYWPMSVASF